MGTTCPRTRSKRCSSGRSKIALVLKGRGSLLDRPGRGGIYESSTSPIPCPNRFSSSRLMTLARRRSELFADAGKSSP